MVNEHTRVCVVVGEGAREMVRWERAGGRGVGTAAVDEGGECPCTALVYGGGGGWWGRW